VTSDVPALVVDALGRRCPVPVIELAKHLDDVAVGDVISVLSDDPASRIDIPVWCRMKGHEYAGSEPAESGTAHHVRRLH
jgi:cysteine desulfurase